MEITILFIGDIVGKIGRKAVANSIGEIKKETGADIVIANGENATHGNGISEKCYNELLDMGIGCVTLGDHAFDRKEIFPVLDKKASKIIRPANYPDGLPGSGEKIIEIGSKKILVINLIGRVFMKMDYDCPFRKLDEILKRHERRSYSAIFVDFHAEATSEKRAFQHYADGRVSAIAGTHTHIQTSDETTTKNGTGYITDTGMVGATDSVIGVNKEAILYSFLNQISMPKEPPDSGECIVNAVVFTVDPRTKKCKNVRRIDKKVNI